jgi:hypothetical protein
VLSLLLTVKHPAPVSILNKRSANEGAHACADREDHRHEAEILRTLAKGHQVADDEIDQHVNAAASDTLYGPTRDEHGTRVRATSDATSENQKGDGRYGEPSAPKQVGQLTIHWLCHGAGQQKGVDDPGIIVAQTELVGNGACCIGNNYTWWSVVMKPIYVGVIRITCSFKGGK